MLVDIAVMNTEILERLAFWYIQLLLKFCPDWSIQSNIRKPFFGYVMSEQSHYSKLYELKRLLSFVYFDLTKCNQS
jgi:hypothetical protein